MILSPIILSKLAPAKFLRVGVLCSIFIILSGCAGIRPPRGVERQTFVIETTGYCPCGKCCGWKRSLIPPFKPVFSSGPNRGKPKRVGITASGTKAKKGTVAADTRFYPFGTVMDVPGYGMCRVEDVGSAIKGPARIDLFFDSHKEAVKWGRKRLSIHVWNPE